MTNALPKPGNASVAGALLTESTAAMVLRIQPELIKLTSSPIDLAV
jgi:hypothetical protein